MSIPGFIEVVMDVGARLSTGFLWLGLRPLLAPTTEFLFIMLLMKFCLLSSSSSRFKSSSEPTRGEEPSDSKRDISGKLDFCSFPVLIEALRLFLISSLLYVLLFIKGA